MPAYTVRCKYPPPSLARAQKEPSPSFPSSSLAVSPKIEETEAGQAKREAEVNGLRERPRGGKGQTAAGAKGRNHLAEKKKEGEKAICQGWKEGRKSQDMQGGIAFTTKRLAHVREVMLHKKRAKV